MNIQQINPKIISITQLRKDIDALNKILAEEDETWVVKNQDVLFVTIKPEKYQQMKEEKTERISQAIKLIESIRAQHKSDRELALNYVIKMRDERIAKWKK